MRLADLIHGERTKRGWSQAELARRAGVSASAVNRLEAGTRLGHADTVARVAGALGINPSTVQALLNEEPESPEIQYVDLSKVPENERSVVRRAIEALVREFEKENGTERLQPRLGGVGTRGSRDASGEAT